MSLVLLPSSSGLVSTAMPGSIPASSNSFFRNLSLLLLCNPLASPAALVSMKRCRFPVRRPLPGWSLYLSIFRLIFGPSTSWSTRSLVINLCCISALLHPSKVARSNVSTNMASAKMNPDSSQWPNREATSSHMARYPSTVRLLPRFDSFQPALKFPPAKLPSHVSLGPYPILSARTTLLSTVPGLALPLLGVACADTTLSRKVSQVMMALPTSKERRLPKRPRRKTANVLTSTARLLVRTQQMPRRLPRRLATKTHNPRRSSTRM